MRVYELAKKLGMESRLLIPELVRLGIEVTSHSNTLDDESAARIVEALQGSDLPAGSLKSLNVKGADAEKGIAQHKKGESRNSSVRQGAKSGRGSSAVISEEPKKPEKKHILIKKKKAVEDEVAPEVPMSEGETPIDVDVQEPIPLSELPTIPSELPSPASPVTIPQPAAELSQPPILEEQKEGEGAMVAHLP